MSEETIVTEDGEELLVCGGCGRGTPVLVGGACLTCGATRRRRLRRLFSSDRRYDGCEGMTTDPQTEDEKARWK